MFLSVEKDLYFVGGTFMYTVGHKDGIFFLRSNIETYYFFFGSFITFEQINDYEIIPEYLGDINICKCLRYVT